MITVTIWHNVARDGEGRPTGMLDGYQPGDPMVRVFTYQADPAGRDPEEIAEEAFAICNGQPRDAGGRPAEMARRYRDRASCGRCPSPEAHRVATSRVGFTGAPCGPDRRRGRRASGRPASVSQVQGGRTDDGQGLAAAGATARPARRFAGGEVVAAARCPVDVSTYPRRHVIVVKHAGERQTFSVHEVAHNHVEWVGGQGHYDLGYAAAIRLMAENVVGPACGACRSSFAGLLRERP